MKQISIAIPKFKIQNKLEIIIILDTEDLAKY